MSQDYNWDKKIQPTLTFSKLSIATLGQCTKSVQS